MSQPWRAYSREHCAVPKKRLDIILVERGLASTRKKAQALIMSGNVLVADTPVEKAGAAVAEDAVIRLRGSESPFVGRGGEKMQGAIECFAIDPTGYTILDIGSSTGGFTDCLLQAGAKKSYAVDVGTNQLHVRLRSDPRVIVKEQTHVADLCPEDFQEKVDLIVVDVSFIGLQKVLPMIAALGLNEAKLLLLVKPQFELEPELIDKGGVVNDEELQLEALRRVKHVAEELGFGVLAEAASVIRGDKKGNQEYFLYLSSAAH